MRYLMWMWLLIVLCACQGDSDTTTIIPPTIDPKNAPFFPQLKPTQPPAPSMEAIIDGTLVLDGRCIHIQALDTRYLLIWEPSVRIFGSGGAAVRMVDPKNQINSFIGEHVRVSGGGVNRSSPLLDGLYEPLPIECPGPYWLASGFVR